MNESLDCFQQQNGRLILPLYFSCISKATQGCQYEVWKIHAPIYYGDNSNEFIVEFLRIVLWKNIVYEDVMMSMSSWSLEKGV